MMILSDGLVAADMTRIVKASNAMDSVNKFLHPHFIAYEVQTQAQLFPHSFIKSPPEMWHKELQYTPSTREWSINKIQIAHNSKDTAYQIGTVLWYMVSSESTELYSRVILRDILSLEDYIVDIPLDDRTQSEISKVIMLRAWHHVR